MGNSRSSQITGSTAEEISDSIRSLIQHGDLTPDDTLPPVRTLAEQLGVNRNTVVAAYRSLAGHGLVRAQGRAGTRVASLPSIPQEGFANAGPLRDLGSGNPNPQLIPPLAPALAEAVGRPVLYGEPVIDPGFEAWARQWMAPDVPDDADCLTLTSGAVDAIERLLAQALVRGDAVALEDPCFLASIQTVRHAGYRTIPVPVDDQGMTVDGLRAALDDGARAIVTTPRAQNPTGASRSAQRARQLRTVLAEHPYVLVIDDDYYSLLSRAPFHSIIGPDHRRWALVRSVSKFLGPDLCLAVVASDSPTAEGLARRLSPGTTWVSHLLQRITHHVLRDPEARILIDRAGAHYAARNEEAARRLGEAGIDVAAADGLNLWAELPVPAREAAAGLEQRGWLVRCGDDFRLSDGGGPSRCIRLTVHDLQDKEIRALAADVADVVHGRRD